MKQKSVAVVALALASVSAIFGAYTWLLSRDLNTTSWASGFDVFGGLAKHTYSSGGYTGIGSTSGCGQMLGSGWGYPGAAAMQMVIRMPGSIPVGASYSAYVGAQGPLPTDPGPLGQYYRADVKTSSVVLYFNDATAGLIQVGSATITPHDNMTLLLTVGLKTGVYVDGVLKLTDSGRTTSGTQGVGVGTCNTGSGYLITHIDVGPLDYAVPNAVPSASIVPTSFTNHIDLTWPAASDDPSGMGVMHYEIWRGGVLVGSTTGLTYSDTTVTPSTPYSYSLVVVDYFFNTASTAFSARSEGYSSSPPYPSSSPEGRRVGVRTTGAYWGASGENIDVRSGNLSFSLPLLTLKSRAGFGATFSLSYNSQNWRNDSGVNWNYDGDVGYGFGWRLMAGSITPVWNAGGMTASYFLFMDSTGAEYRLDQPSGNIWSSKDSVYVYFDANTNILHFRNGTYWYFGCVSEEVADAGVMYPTLMQDTHGNQITIAYQQASGASWANSSARITTITDVRSAPAATYNFYYSGTPLHLAYISNSIGTGETFVPTYLYNQALASPFDGQSFGNTTFLSSFQLLNGTFGFTHDGSGELTKITLPYGGYLAYDYSTAAYSSGHSFREVVSRYLSKDGSTQTTYPFSHETTLGPDVHAYTILDDPGGVGEKYWAFSTSGTYEGLVSQYQGRQLPGPVALTQNDSTWAQDAVSNSYIANTLTTADPGQTYQAQKQTSQTVDSYGNVTQVQNFDWGNLVTPVRTYNYTYLKGTGSHTYLTDYIQNRLLTATEYDGTYTLTLATNYYDYATPSYIVNYGPGDLTQTTTLSGTSSETYDSYGNPHANTNPAGVVTTATFGSSALFAAPTQITTGSLTDTMTYNTFLGLTNEQGPNGDNTSVGYLNAAQPSSTTSPFGAVTNYAYTVATNASTVKATTLTHWTKNTLDGLGRTTKAEAGTIVSGTSTTLTQTDTVYDSCGCSPLGKLKQTSLPHAPGAGAVWTTYTYDGIGRTLSIQAPDGASTTTYSYQGNTVTVTDPAGAWKTFTSDAFGRLTTVVEPNPAGGTYTTNYSYDLLDHLTSIPTLRSSTAQTHTFNYIDPATSNPGTLLRSTTNPENGTVTYIYDSSMRLSTVTDAKNQQKVMTYDSLSRVTQVQRYYYSGGAYVEDPNKRTNFYYDSNPFGTSQNTSGRLAAVQYYGGHCDRYTLSNVSWNCELMQESYGYNQAGAKLSKTVKVSRGPSATLTASWTYDTEGHVTGITYPSWQGCSTCTVVSGSHYTLAYDNMGRMNTMTDTVNTHTLISGITYGVANEVQQITSGYTTGVNSETRTFNGMFQLTQLHVASTLNIQYNFSATQNNGKITSQSDIISGEQLAYTYDALNRLASAQTTQTGGTQWGQSYTYDGFGNLTDQTVIKGAAPDVHVTYNASNNLQTGDTADANGNIGAGYVYDIDNRLVQPGSSSTVDYGYDVENKRVWRGDSSSGLDEIAFWAGQKLATYQVSSGGSGVYFALTTTNVYFGSKLISKGSYSTSWTDKVALTPVAADRQGSIGKFYPYGTERPSATGNDKEKFTGYYRDASTGLDYADQRYHQPGAGRFVTPDPYSGSARAGNPGSQNRYAYVGGDPVNSTDRSGLDDGFISDGDPGDDPFGDPGPTCNSANFIDLWLLDPCAQTGSPNPDAGIWGITIVVDQPPPPPPTIEIFGFGTGFGDYGTLTVPSVGILDSFQFLPGSAAGAAGAIICAADPICDGAVVVVGGAITIYVLASQVHNLVKAITAALDKPTTIDIDLCYQLWEAAKKACFASGDPFKMFPCIQLANLNYTRCKQGLTPITPLPGGR